MTTNLLIYADNEYYNLEYNTSTTDHTMTKISDDTNNLLNIIPLAMYSNNTSHCIIDIDNNINYIRFPSDNLNVPHKIYRNVGKVTLNKFKIIGLDITKTLSPLSPIVTFRILLKNLEDCPSRSYEYIVHSVEYNNVHTVQKILNDSNVAPHNGSYKCTMKFDDTYPIKVYFYARYNDTILLDLDDNEIPNISYRVPQQPNKIIPQGFRICDNYTFDIIIKYTFVISDNGDCSVVKHNTRTKVFTLDDNSIVLNVAHSSNNGIIIVTNNHIIDINNRDVLQFKLAVKHLQYIANTKVGNIMWSKEIHCRLPIKYKRSIEAFMMCNRLMGKFRIPYCVLQVVFSIIII